MQNTLLSIDERLASLPVAPEVRARTLLTYLWRLHDNAGISMGRSHESVVLEAAMALLGSPDFEDLSRLDNGDVIRETRDYLSAVKAKDFGFK